MFCYKCGFEVDDECRFCPQCGASLEHMNQEIDNEQPYLRDPAHSGTKIVRDTGGKASGKRWIVLVASFVVLVVLIGAFIFIKSKPDPILGTWEITQLEIDGVRYTQDQMSRFEYDEEVFLYTITLNKDKSVVYTYNHKDGSKETIDGVWDKDSQDNYKIDLFPDSGTAHATVILKGDTLELNEDGVEETIIYKKAD